MLIEIDGIESLKRVQRQKEVVGGDGEVRTVSAERPDTRHRPARTEVEHWEVEIMKDEVANAKVSKQFELLP